MTFFAPTWILDGAHKSVYVIVTFCPCLPPLQKKNPKSSLTRKHCTAGITWILWSYYDTHCFNSSYFLRILLLWLPKLKSRCCSVRKKKMKSTLVSGRSVWKTTKLKHLCLPTTLYVLYDGVSLLRKSWSKSDIIMNHEQYPCQLLKSPQALMLYLHVFL